MFRRGLNAKFQNRVATPGSCPCWASTFRWERIIPMGNGVLRSDSAVCALDRKFAAALVPKVLPGCCDRFCLGGVHLSWSGGAVVLVGPTTSVRRNHSASGHINLPLYQLFVGSRSSKGARQARDLVGSGPPFGGPCTVRGLKCQMLRSANQEAEIPTVFTEDPPLGTPMDVTQTVDPPEASRRRRRGGFEWYDWIGHGSLKKKEGSELTTGPSSRYSE